MNQHAELFKLYHADNPEVGEMFERFATELLTAGVKRFGAKAIGERIRYESAVRVVKEPGKEFAQFKVNNNYWAYYARWLTMKDPQKWRGFFEFRDVPLKEGACP